MNKDKILHVMVLDKFLAPFIDFVDEHFGREEHHYVFITSEKYNYGLTPEHNVEFLHTDDDIYITLLEYMKISKKIILHGLWRDKVDVLLYFNQELLKKCYWVMWGGDFYFPETKSKIRHEIIKHIDNYISSTQNDIFYIENNYFVEAKNIFFSQFYPTCIPDFEPIKNTNKSDIIKILVGNSATDTNRHKEVFEILKQYKNENIEIIVPLSYGNLEYKAKILEEGKYIFKNKFKAIVEFLDFEEYIELLASVDIAIFNNNRQQAGGNIKVLSGYGKKIYLSKDNSFYDEFKNNSIITYDLDKFNLQKISSKISRQNINITKRVYSFESLLSSWKDIFEN